jgi:predicted nucleic acid-binding protein
VGLSVDTSSLVRFERGGLSAQAIFNQIRAAHGPEVTPALSAVLVVELLHGIERAKAEAQRLRRQSFLADLLADIPVYPVTTEIALLAGRIAGQEAERGINLPLADLLIGTTALHLGYEVFTDNVKHFAMIPNLVVKQI